MRQGRAFGIHVILGSQTLGGAYSLARSTIDQMAVRIALQCSEADAHLILSKENSEARLLSRPGEAIYNAANGLLEGNNLFQIVWITDKRRDDYLVMTEELARRRGMAALDQIVFEGSAPSDLTKNPCLARLRAGQKEKFAGTPCWLGESVAIKDPTAAVFRKQSGANLLMAGQNGETAFSPDGCRPRQPGRAAKTPHRGILRARLRLPMVDDLSARGGHDHGGGVRSPDAEAARRAADSPGAAA